MQPASSIRCLISGTAAAASGTLTVTRTISDPASASSMHWRAVAGSVGGVGHGHRLDHHRCAAADLYTADAHADRSMQFDGCGRRFTHSGRLMLVASMIPFPS